MAINPLETLIENTVTISDNISPAKAAYILSQLLVRVGYDEQPTENTVEEVSPDDREARRTEDSARQTSQEEAIQTLSEIIGSLSIGKSYKEAVITAFEVEELVEEVEQTVLPLEGDGLTVSTDIIEEVVTSIEERIPHSQQNIEEIRKHVIPIVLETLEFEGATIKSESNQGEYTRFYESDKSILLLNVSSEGKQYLTYDRKTSMENESLRALEATRESPEKQFEIIVYNMTQSEINRFKEAIAQLEVQKNFQKNSQKVMSKTQQEELA